MKLTILGGAGIRTPLLIEGLLKYKDINFGEIVLYDIDEEKLTLIGKLTDYILKNKNSSIKISYTSDIRKAVRDAEFIYAAIRVGNEEARIVDEKIPLKHSVLGQETTGPGGFVMALRTIPIMLEYSQIINEEAPNAWLLNFSNPSGLITQALYQYGYHDKVIGICDAHTGMKNELSKYLGVSAKEIQVNYFGLNHLGWVPSVYVEGQNKINELINSYDQLRQSSHIFSFFDTDLIKQINMLPNEYLYYFYYSDEAVKNIKKSKETRGEQVLKLSKRLLSILSDKINKGNLKEAYDIYKQHMNTRSETYMVRETTGHMMDDNNNKSSINELEFEEEGYEGLALNFINSIKNNKNNVLTLNVPNKGCIEGLGEEDVVEVQCLVNKNGVFPLSVGAIPDMAMSLIKPIKTYERLTVEAAVSGNYHTAVKALTVHPLVSTYTLAKEIFDEYLEAFKSHLSYFKV